MDEREELGEDRGMRNGCSLSDNLSTSTSLAIAFYPQFSPLLCISPSLPPSLPLSLNLSILLLSRRPPQTGVKSSGASKAAVWRLHVMWEPQQPCLQTPQTAAATVDPQPASFQ